MNLELDNIMSNDLSSISELVDKVFYGFKEGIEKDLFNQLV